MTRSRALGLCLVGLAVCGCGGGRTTQRSPPAASGGGTTAAASETWVDTTYAPNPTVLASLAIAPVPYAGEHAHEIDEALERVFIDTPGSQLRGQPGIIRQRMNGNRQFVLVIDRIRSLRYGSAALAAANLNQLLTPRELADLRTSLNSASMLIMPIEFVVEPKGGGTDGHALYRVYSLETGKLLLQNRLQRHIAQAGDVGERETLIQLILALQADFAERLMP